MRATLDTETLVGPNFWRLSVDPSNQLGKFFASRWPVINVLAAQVSPASAIPTNYSTIPLTAITVVSGYDPDPDNSFDPNAAASGAFEIEIAPGYVTWANGRSGCRVQISYINGWPHTSLTATATEGSTTLQVDDVTGFTNLYADIFDSPYDEQVQVTGVTANNPITTPAPSSASVPVGPGTLTLASPTISEHAKGTMVSTMPYSIQQAAISLATHVALVRGASSFTVGGALPRRRQTAEAMRDLLDEADGYLAPYKRVV